jgi:hypothetical protein
MDLIDSGISRFSEDHIAYGPYFQPGIIKIMRSLSCQKLHLLVFVFPGICLGLAVSLALDVADICIGLAHALCLQLNVADSGS